MPKIVITGAAGKIATVLRTHLTAETFTLRLIDKDPAGDLAIHRADLAETDPGWTALFDGADAVIHLAARTHPAAPWSELVAPNIDAVLNLYRAAALHKVPHIIFASSIWAAAARRADQGPIDAGCSDPGDNAYGASKVFAERVAHGFWRSDGVATTILRIGALATGASGHGLRKGWDAEARLSPRDLCDAVDRALRMPPAGVRTLNLISHNAGARFTLDEARDTIGYVPQDRFTPPPRTPLAIRLLRRLSRPKLR